MNHPRPRKSDHPKVENVGSANASPQRFLSTMAARKKKIFYPSPDPNIFFLFQRPRTFRFIMSPSCSFLNPWSPMEKNCANMIICMSPEYHSERREGDLLDGHRLEGGDEGVIPAQVEKLLTFLPSHFFALSCLASRTDAENIRPAR